MRSIAIRRTIDDWFEENDLTPRVVAEFDDSALMKAFGEASAGAFPAPLAISKEICKKYNVVEVGMLGNARETYYAISPERRLRHPAVLQITDRARNKLFA